MSSDDFVHLGPWINWTKGRVQGATITMTAGNSVLLVAIIALFVRLVGSHLWSILCYAIHQWRSKRGERDALHHQQQALLRNSSSVTTTVWLWVQLAWAWRSKTNHPLWRSLALVVAAALQIVIFGIAGIFSSRITVTGNEALARSLSCGSWPVDFHFESTNFQDFSNQTALSIQEQSAYAINARRQVTRSLAYAQSCYLSESPIGCNNNYILPFLPQSIDVNASCPFDEALCRTQAVQIDTGLLDSAVHLGINARMEDRISYRKTTTCAVLSIDGYAFSKVTADDENAAYPYVNSTYFNYGPNRLEQTDYTDVFSNYTYNGTYDFWYDVTSASSLQDFTPIPEFHGDDSDIDILFLLNKMRYLTQIDDPWFSAHQELDFGGGILEYEADHNPAPLGCRSQHQFCNPNLPEAFACTELTGWNQTLFANATPSFNENQITTYLRVLQAAFDASFNQVIIALDNGALQASGAVAENRAIGLPVGQWKDETVNLNSIMLAYIQSLIVSYVTGPEIASDVQYIQSPGATFGQQMCENQIITSTAYYSFSVLGLSIILVFGGLIILVNLTLEPLIRFIRRLVKNDTGAYRQLEWDLTESLQLQRLVYEGQGTGTWKGDPNNIPVAARDDRFGIPQWHGEGEARRVSRDVMSFGNPSSPLMKQDVRTTVTEL